MPLATMGSFSEYRVTIAGAHLRGGGVVAGKGPFDQSR
jgi:hypothetical protein